MKILRVIQAIFLVAIGGAAGYRLAYRQAPAPLREVGQEQENAEPLKDVDVNTVTVRDMARYVQRAHPQFIADWTSMARAHIYPEQVVTVDLHLHHPTLGQFLAKMSLPMNAENRHLGFLIENGVLTMSAGGFQETGRYDDRSFDVSDLLRADGAWEKLGYSADPYIAKLRPGSREYRHELLVATLKHVVDPGSWMASEGSSRFVEIRIDLGTLDVTQTYENDDLIEEVLKILREAQ